MSALVGYYWTGHIDARFKHEEYSHNFPIIKNHSIVDALQALELKKHHLDRQTVHYYAFIIPLKTGRDQ